MAVRLERVVAGVDFGEPSVAAARWAATRLAPKAELVLVHVLQVDEPRWIRARPPPRRVVELAREAAELRLRELTRTVGAPLVFTEVAVGNPAERIAAVAAELEADLVVVGPHGRQPPRWSVLGSTAERLVRGSERPVLIGRDPRPRRPAKILVPVDELELPAGVRPWMALLDGEIVVLTVLGRRDTEPRMGSPLVGWSGAPVPESVLRGQFARWLDRARRELGLSRRSVVPVVEFGDPARRIVEFARAHGTDLVVISTRGAGAVRRAFLGSVTASVIRGAPCPVLVVPMQEGRRARRRIRRARPSG